MMECHLSDNVYDLICKSGSNVQSVRYIIIFDEKSVYKTDKSLYLPIPSPPRK
jgi:hypothetical protein